MKTLLTVLRVGLVVALMGSLSACDDPQVYGSVGVSSGFGSWSGSSGPRVHTSISVGGRIR